MYSTQSMTLIFLIPFDSFLSHCTSEYLVVNEETQKRPNRRDERTENGDRKQVDTHTNPDMGTLEKLKKKAEN